MKLPGLPAQPSTVSGQVCSSLLSGTPSLSLKGRGILRVSSELLERGGRCHRGPVCPESTSCLLSWDVCGRWGSQPEKQEASTTPAPGPALHAHPDSSLPLLHTVHTEISISKTFTGNSPYYSLPSKSMDLSLSSRGGLNLPSLLEDELMLKSS